MTSTSLGQVRVDISLYGGAAGNEVGAFVYSNQGQFICSGYYTYTGPGSYGAAVLYEHVQLGSQCSDSPAVVAPYGKTGNQIWWQSGTNSTQNAGALTRE